MEVNLRLQVNKSDAINIIKWLRNENVTKFLNEDVHSSDVLEKMINNNEVDLLTFSLNRNGHFFLIDTFEEKCVGFISLFTIRKNKEYEVVIAVGDPSNWGKGIGKHALKKVLREVFIKMRIDKLVSKIHVENSRSIELFEHLGFQSEQSVNKLRKYYMTLDTYLKSLRK